MRRARRVRALRHVSSAVSTGSFTVKLRRSHFCAPRCVILFCGGAGPTNGFFQGVPTMTAKKKTRAREAIAVRVNGRELPLRNHAERALSDYFTSLNGHRPAHLYDLVLREVEEPLFRVVLDYAEGNQSRAAGILGINRGTLRKKLKQFGLAGS
jgi:Fis family transcriptional regulator